MADTNGATNGTNAVDQAQALDFTTFKNVINGKLVDTKAHRQGIKPATSEPHVDVPVSAEADLDNAVNAAREAFKSWLQTSYEERKAKLLAYADALEAEKEGFVKLLTTEQGKPVRIPIFNLNSAKTAADVLYLCEARPSVTRA
jgi:acyl-CoA reductase-like NAD-dependent aldehyde dehydrogenase